VKSRHFRRSEYLDSVALDISLVRRNLHRSSKDFAISFVKSMSFVSRKWSRRGNSLRQAPSAFGSRSSWLWKNIAQEDIRNYTASLLHLHSQPVGNVQFALYCGKHRIRRIRPVP